MNSKIERAMQFLIQDNAFFGTVLMHLSIQENNDLEFPAGICAGADGNIILYINTNQLREFTFLQLVGLLEHEVLHIILVHIVRGSDKNREVILFNKRIRLWNLATDMAVNSLILPERLTENVVLPETFQCPRDMAAESYYYALSLQMNATVPFTSIDAHTWEGISENVIKKILLKNSTKHAYELYKRSNSGKVVFPYPDNNDGVLRPFDSDSSRLKTDTPWQSVLRRFMFQQLKAKPRNTWKIPNRRFQYSPGKRKTRMSKIAVAIDTSGSISEDQFASFIREVKKILALYQNIQVIILEADDEIQKVYYGLNHKVKIDFIGGGNTDFEPVFDYIIKHKLKIDLLIYFTDLMGNFPPNHHKIPFKTLWVTTQASKEESQSVPFGTVIELKKGVRNNEAE